MTTSTRIAFVPNFANAYAHRLAVGVSRFARPTEGFVVREFVVGKGLTGVPAAFAGWKPDAVVASLPAESEEILHELASEGRPVVNTARVSPAAGRAVVVGDADGLLRRGHWSLHLVWPASHPRSSSPIRPQSQTACETDTDATPNRTAFR